MALTAVTFGVGICNVFFDIAYQTFVPELVPYHNLGKANSALVFIRSAAQLTGPMLAGLLATAYRPEFMVSINSATFVMAFLALLLLPARYRIPAASESAPEKTSGWGLKPLLGDIGMGLGYVWRSQQIRLVVIAGALSKIFAAAITALFALLVTRTLSLGQVLIGYGTPVLNIGLVTLRQRLTPAALLGRVNASARVAIMSSLPLGALLISGSAELSSTMLAFWIAAIGQLVVLLILGALLLRLSIPDQISTD